MPEFLIEKDIPKDQNPFLTAAKKMEVGDSVKLDTQKDADALGRALLKAHGVGSFTIRTLDEGGFRVWRDQRTVTPRKPRKTATPVEGAAV